MFQSKARRRRQIREVPFPAEWRELLRQSSRLYRCLPEQDREELHATIQVLLAEKRFEGAAGLAVTEEMRLLVAAQAGCLLLHRATGFYPKLLSVVLYPGEYAVQEDVADESGLVEELDESRSGESWTSGTLILSWEDVERDLDSKNQNVVLHEFAHQLDAEDGAMNGAPILTDPALRERWPDVMTGAYDRLCDAADRDAHTVLDPYGAEDPAEFFAVATEAFFLDPARLEAAESSLYDVLRAYYQQDPARWPGHPATTSHGVDKNRLR